ECRSLSRVRTGPASYRARALARAAAHAPSPTTARGRRARTPVAARRRVCRALGAVRTDGRLAERWMGFAGGIRRIAAGPARHGGDVDAARRLPAVRPPGQHELPRRGSGERG